MVALLALLSAGALRAQQSPAKQRAALAAQQQKALRDEGCARCRVWVSGKDSVTLNVLDPEAPSGDNDYKGRPVLWFSAGFTKVIYYSAPGRVYAQHTK